MATDNETYVLPFHARMRYVGESLLHHSPKQSVDETGLYMAGGNAVVNGTDNDCSERQHLGTIEPLDTRSSRCSEKSIP